MSSINPSKFFKEVRQEVSKVTWPTWKEVWITTLMVLIMVAMAAVFFLIADQLLGWLINLILGHGQNPIMRTPGWYTCPAGAGSLPAGSGIARE